MNEDLDYLKRRIEDWSTMPILGHGLWARYQDSQVLISDAIALLEAGRERETALRSALAAVVTEMDATKGWYFPCLQPHSKSIVAARGVLNDNP